MTDEERDTLLLDIQDVLLYLQKEVLANMQNDVSNLKTDLSNLKADVRRVSQSVAVIEIEHGNKIQALLDAQVQTIQKLESFEKRFESDEVVLDNHTLRILNLESKAANQ